MGAAKGELRVILQSAPRLITESVGDPPPTRRLPSRNRRATVRRASASLPLEERKQESKDR